MTGESIVVVEDEGFIALQITELLEKNGFVVPGTFAYGEDAVAMADRSPPDLICMDIELMGELDGIETARRIREHHDIPIIYMTAFSDAERLSRAKETGPYSFLVKPVNERELLVAIEMAIHRHRMDREVRETMERYRAVVDTAAEGIMLVACGTGKIFEANRALGRLTGYSPAELDAMTFADLAAPGGSPADWNARICRPGGWSGEMKVTCRDGSVRDVELATQVVARSGAPSFTCCVAHDVTDRKRVELSLREAHRKLTLLSGITRHDIMNQLMALAGFLELTRPAVSGTPAEVYVEKEIAAAHTIERMISFTREYEQIGQQQPGWHRPDPIIRAIARDANAPGVALDLRLEGLEVYADPLIDRVFHNLLDNAIRHGKSVSRITVTAGREGPGLVVRWEDNGTGIPDADKERIFDRGFGSHTGLGLFLAREILSLTGIAIRENGHYGSGARFELLVPAGAFRYAGPSPDVSPAAGIPGH